MQCPDASRVAGFRKWQELKRQVRKGEKAIKILGPVIVKIESDEKPGTYEKRVVGFKGVSVFDVSQTDGDPLPVPPIEPITGDSHAALLPKLKAYAKELGYRFLEEGMAGGKGGYCDSAAKIIAVDQDTPVNRKVRTAVHELAHALGIDYKKYTRHDSEVIVETVTVMVCDAIGLDTTGESVPYITGWGERGGLKALKEFAETINKTAATIEKAVA